MTTQTETQTETQPRPTIASRETWRKARIALLQREKELTHLRDELARERLALPWVRVEKDYSFDTPHGRRTLGELFEGRSQLYVQHFMFAPGKQEGCVGCSFMADHLDGMRVHLENHDVKVVAISRAPLAEIEAFRARMGWDFDWVSSAGNDFNQDHHVSFTPEQLASGQATYNFAPWQNPGEDQPGISAFARDTDGVVYHTYSSFGRGVEEQVGTYRILDLMPKGRNEPVHGNMRDWLRHHDRYEGAGAACCSPGARS